MSDQIKQRGAWRVFGIFLWIAGLNISHAQNIVASAPLLRYEVVATYPHDPAHYTQGLVFDRGRLYESVGQYGRSAVLEKELQTGRTVRRTALNAQFFGEGLAAVGDRLIQLTWRERTGFVYNRALKRLQSFSYDGEGWGLATHAKDTLLVMSDGTSMLRFLDAQTFAEQRRITVHHRGEAVTHLNELEVVHGLVYANVWLTDDIAILSPDSGAVVSWLDLSSLKDRFAKPADWNPRDHVLNGIAYHAAHNTLLVTGKNWPSLFEIRVLPLTQTPSGTATPQ